VALPSGLFDFFTLEQVTAIHARAAVMLAEGKTVMSWSGEGKSGGKQFTMPVADVLAECNYRLRALNQGPRIVRRVKADFSKGIQ
jgi:hypothetical protein